MMSVVSQLKEGSGVSVGEYCSAANAVAIIDSKNICTGEIRVKGSGMGKEDIYNQSYDRKCPLADVCQRRRLV